MAIIPQRLLFNDGEGLDLADLNNAQAFMQSFLRDGLIRETASRFPAPGSQFAPPFGGFLTSSVIYAPGDGGGIIYSGSTRTTAFRDGMICAPKATPTAVDGINPTWWAYWMTSAEVPTKTRPAATTNPRWDVLSVAFVEASGDPETRDFEDASTRALTSVSMNKRNRVTATFTWTQGTESASPVEPSTPAGEFKICSVMVSPGMGVFDAFADPAEVRDYRVPFSEGVSMKLAVDENWRVSGATATTIVGAAGAPSYLFVSVGGGAEYIRYYSICPFNSGRHRIYGATMYADISSGTASSVDMTMYSSYQGTTSSINSWGTANFPSTLEDNYLFQPDGPLWANGYAAGLHAETTPLYIPKRVFLQMSIPAGAIVDISLNHNRWLVKGG